MTHFEEIKKMNADEFAKFLVDASKFPNSPCYLCEHDEGLNCASPVACTEEYRASVYKEWLESEV